MICAAENQENFIKHMTHYMNGAIFSRSDLIVSLLSPNFSIKKYSERIKNLFFQISTKMPKCIDNYSYLKINPYSCSNPHVLRMQKFIYKYLKDDLVGVCIHGSLGSYEEIPYSDFDALVIVKNNVFEESSRLIRAAKKLNSARSLMYDFDLLQHHGWFVLAEANLEYFPDYYFPVELFNYSKSLFPKNGLDLNIKIFNSPERVKKYFIKLSDNIINQIKDKDYPRNLYQLKKLLSQFMLLPAKYVHARDGKGIYKKLSFDVAKVDFSERDWSIMKEVSKIRIDWKYEISGIKRTFLKKNLPLSRYFVKNFSPKIPLEILNILNDKFYQRMEYLSCLMQEHIRE